MAGVYRADFSDEMNYLLVGNSQGGVDGQRGARKSNDFDCQLQGEGCLRGVKTSKTLGDSLPEQVEDSLSQMQIFSVPNKEVESFDNIWSEIVSGVEDVREYVKVFQIQHPTSLLNILVEKFRPFQQGVDGLELFLCRRFPKHQVELLETLLVDIRSRVVVDDVRNAVGS